MGASLPKKRDFFYKLSVPLLTERRDIPNIIILLFYGDFNRFFENFLFCKGIIGFQASNLVILRIDFIRIIVYNVKWAFA